MVEAVSTKSALQADFVYLPLRSLFFCVVTAAFGNRTPSVHVPDPAKGEFMLSPFFAQFLRMSSRMSKLVGCQPYRASRHCESMLYFNNIAILKCWSP